MNVYGRRAPMRRLNIQLTEEQYEALRLIAFRERRSIADVIREAVERLVRTEAEAHEYQGANK